MNFQDIAAAAAAFLSGLASFDGRLRPEEIVLKPGAGRFADIFRDKVPPSAGAYWFFLPCGTVFDIGEADTNILGAAFGEDRGSRLARRSGGGVPRHDGRRLGIPQFQPSERPHGQGRHQGRRIEGGVPRRLDHGHARRRGAFDRGLPPDPMSRRLGYPPETALTDPRPGSRGRWPELCCPDGGSSRCVMDWTAAGPMLGLALLQGPVFNLKRCVFAIRIE